MRKYLFLLLAIIMLAGLLAACTGAQGESTTAAVTATTTAKTTAAATTAAATTAATTTAATGSLAYTKENVNAAGVLPIVREKEELGIMIGINTNVIDFETNEITKLMEERTNIHINWDVVAEYAQSKNLALASGDLPEVLGGLITETEAVAYGDRGVLVDLKGYIEEYGYWIKDMFAYDASVEPALTIPSGKIVTMPNYSLTYHSYSDQKGWVRMDWLETLGLSYPDTTEDFYNMLVAFRDGDPNGNGEKDEIPMIGVGVMTGVYGTVPYLMNAFIPFKAGSYWVQPYDWKQVDVVLNKPDFLEGLTYIRSLYAEGLIDTECFTQDNTLAKQKMTNNQVGFAVAHAVSGIVDTQSPVFEQLDIVLPLTGPSGVKLAPLTNGSGLVQKTFAVTSSCKNPVTAFRWQDSMYEEDPVQMWLALGLEGKEWRYAEAGEVGINGEPAIYALLQRTYPTNNSWVQSIASFRTSEWRLGEASVYGDNYFVYPAQETRLYNATKQYMEYCPLTIENVVPYTIYIDNAIAAEYADLQTTIREYANQNVALFITGDRPLTEWDAYCQELEAMGLSRYLEWTQQSIAAAR